MRVTCILPICCSIFSNYLLSAQKKKKRKKKIGLIIHVVNILLWKAFYRLTFDAFPVDICPFLQQVLRYLLVPLVA